MADALLSPAVGLSFAALSGAALAVSASRLSKDADDRKVPLMGVLGAFVFASQMINFSIPGTGSSGHMVGGILLLLLLGPYAAFITLTSVLIVQALFFADGGILALGTNIWNMGFYTCFVGWLILKFIAGKDPTRVRISIAAVIAAVLALELGAISVVLETVLSGRSELPLGKFSLLMLGIHLPIGLIEGLVTVAVVNFVYRIRPEAVTEGLHLGWGVTSPAAQSGSISYRPVIIAMAAGAVVIGGALAWFASGHPDGLEWSIWKTTGQEELSADDSGMASSLGRLQERTSLLPDYDFKDAGEEGLQAEDAAAEESWPNVSPGTSVSGIVGSIIVLVLVSVLGVLMLKLRGRGEAG